MYLSTYRLKKTSTLEGTNGREKDKSFLSNLKLIENTRASLRKYVPKRDDITVLKIKE